MPINKDSCFKNPFLLFTERVCDWLRIFIEKKETTFHLCLFLSDLFHSLSFYIERDVLIAAVCSSKWKSLLFSDVPGCLMLHHTRFFLFSAYFS